MKVFELDKDNLKLIERINALIDSAFPEYLHTNVEARLQKYHSSDFPKVKIFFIEEEGNPVSFAQIIYKLWNDRLVANLDLLGSHYLKRRKGYAETLFQHCRYDYCEEIRKQKMDSVGLLTFVDPNYDPIVRFHIKNDGQIRNDIISDFGDIVVWYPSNKESMNIKTSELMEQMKEFGLIINTF
jgi:hypothetical protein